MILRKETERWGGERRKVEKGARKNVCLIYLVRVSVTRTNYEFERERERERQTQRETMTGI